MERFLCERLLDEKLAISEQFRVLFSLRNLLGTAPRNALILDASSLRCSKFFLYRGGFPRSRQLFLMHGLSLKMREQKRGNQAIILLNWLFQDEIFLEAIMRNVSDIISRRDDHYVALGWCILGCSLIEYENIVRDVSTYVSPSDIGHAKKRKLLLSSLGNRRDDALPNPPTKASEEEKHVKDPCRENKDLSTGKSLHVKTSEFTGKGPVSKQHAGPSISYKYSEVTRKPVMDSRKWLKLENPLPYLARFPEADVLTSTDQVSPIVVDDRLDDWKQAGVPYNIGIFHWRPTPSSIKLAKEWKEILLADDKIWDQNGFNELIRRQLGPSVDEDSGLVHAYDGELKLGLLPASIFCSAHTYFIQAMYRQLRLEPYAVHTTFQYAGTEGKHRLREAMIFYDPPEYYNAPGGFLTFKPNIPKNLLFDGGHNIESHFALVNYQIKQIRTALAIASLLGRTLVMPPIWCRLDRLWFGHPGVLMGTLTRQPFICPLDHVFEVNVMLKEFPEKKLGPGINFREYSFLDNAYIPQQDHLVVEFQTAQI
ncbi:xyloglucanase 113 [Perilla frutescens var. hirtella]|uniref:Xyloglucanase 113 n=1 Tax=Perilla frutescens var. hirtella TaxID=608512 RepID=A0AAD4IYG7_PERFH|nr:xyloglucanase 113 [Perilla frutescens var. hirtella]